MGCLFREWRDGKKGLEGLGRCWGFVGWWVMSDVVLVGEELGMEREILIANEEIEIVGFCGGIKWDV